jgi:phosphoglycolate phosphatase
MKLIIFDMDQTLVDFLSVHDEATRKVFLKYFNVEARLTEVDYSGKSLMVNFQSLARLKNVPQYLFRAKRHLLLEAYEIAFRESLPEEPEKYVLPGVRPLLKKLSKTDHIVVLYTGDSRGIVNHVNRATGLGRYFRFFFYGTEVTTREDMVKQAIKQAESIFDKNFHDRDIVIIGDSVRDVECGRFFNALIIAVATGDHSEEELSREGADYVFKDLSDYQKVLEIIGE